MKVKGQIDDTCSDLDFSVSPDHLVGPLDFEDATSILPYLDIDIAR